jgi:ubiquinone/menaquinone biosynthesis C-methylase UbiE
MINKQWWEPMDMQDAWQKIILNDTEKPEESANTAHVILRGVPTGGTAIDIGCGVGRLMKEMAEHFDVVFGVDISEKMVEFSKEYLKNFRQCYTKLGNGERLPFTNRSADFVYSFITFQHMPSLEVIRTNIQDIARILRPGGVCRIQTIKGNPFYCDERKSPHYLFTDEQEFLDEFIRVGLNGTVEVGLMHPAAIWVTARKET